MLYAYRARHRQPSRCRQPTPTRGAAKRDAGLHEARHRFCSTRAELATGSRADAQQKTEARLCTRPATASALRVQSSPPAAEPTRSERQRWGCARGTPPPILCAYRARRRQPSRRGAKDRGGAVHAARYRQYSARVSIKRAAGSRADTARNQAGGGAVQGTPPSLLYMYSARPGYRVHAARL